MPKRDTFAEYAESIRQFNLKKPDPAPIVTNPKPRKATGTAKTSKPAVKGKPVQFVATSAPVKALRGASHIKALNDTAAAFEAGRVLGIEDGLKMLRAELRNKRG